jgi:hypothetical protein
MKWIKVTERLPTEPGQYFVKWFNLSEEAIEAALLYTLQKLIP